MTTMIAPPQADKLETEVPAIVREANAITVTDAASATAAAEFLRTIKTMLGRVADTFDDIVDKAHKAHKAAVAKRAEFTDPLKQAESVIKRRIGDYQMAEERKRREEEARLRKLEEERAAAETARLRKEEEDRRLAEAEALQAAGDKQAAEELISAPVIVEQVQPAPVIVAPSAPKLEGVATRERWEWETVDPTLIPREYLRIDEAKIGGVVRAMKGATKIPGIKVFPVSQVSAKGW